MPRTFSDPEPELAPPTPHAAEVVADAGTLPGAPSLPLASPAASALLLGGLILAAALLALLAESLARVVAPEDREDGARSGSDPLAHHLERRRSLGESAGLGAQALRVAATLLLLALVQETWGLPWLRAAAVTLVLGAPLLHLATQTLPAALASSRGEGLLRATLPAFAVLSLPLTPVVALLRMVRRALLRAFRSPEADEGRLRMIEGFRAMVESSEFDGDLAAETRELIANAIEFGEVDAAEVMTPRTEIKAIEEDAALSEAVAVFAEASFSRIPVYEGTIDTIIGTLTALEATKAVAEGRLESTRIRDIMRPPLLVPETVRVPDLLDQFRADRQKMAIVVDEYGGTAGLVTLADVVSEIVGHVSDEYEEEHTSFRRLESGAVEADASLHVSEVNEALGLELPEESDFETLGGFVLSEIGRFPAPGETFTADGVTFRVTEASDRRVIRVSMERPGGLTLAREDGPPPGRPRATRQAPETATQLERRGA